MNIQFSWRFEKPEVSFDDQGRAVLTAVTWNRIAVDMEDMSKVKTKQGRQVIPPPNSSKPFKPFNKFVKADFENMVADAMHQESATMLESIDQELHDAISKVALTNVGMPYTEEQAPEPMPMP